MEEERKERNTEEGPADTAEIPAPEELEEAVTVPAGAGEDKDAAAGLEQKLNEANARVQQLERERFLLLRPLLRPVFLETSRARRPCAPSVTATQLQ